MSEMPFDDATDHLLGETDEAKFWGKPQLFANRVWRIYSRVAGDLGFAKRGKRDPDAEAIVDALAVPGQALRQTKLEERVDEELALAVGGRGLAKRVRAGRK